MGPAQLFQQPYPLRLKTSPSLFSDVCPPLPQRGLLCCPGQHSEDSPPYPRPDSKQTGPPLKNQPENPINAPGTHPSPSLQFGMSELGDNSAHSSTEKYDRQRPLGHAPTGDMEGAPDGAFPSEDFRAPDVTEQGQEPTQPVLLGLLISLRQLLATACEVSP